MIIMSINLKKKAWNINMTFKIAYYDKKYIRIFQAYNKQIAKEAIELKTFGKTDVYCQWDPDRDVYGNAVNRMAIQIGIKNNALNDYIEKFIYDITDISKDVTKWREQLKIGKLKNVIYRKNLFIQYQIK